jgi:excisionase family DNA binding protein
MRFTKKSDGWLSLHDAAEYASVSTRTIERWVQQGLLPPPPTLPGRKYRLLRFRTEDLDRVLTPHTVKNKPPSIEQLRQSP